MEDRIMSFKEAMSFLKIPRSTLYKLVQEGRVPATKVGRHWRFSKITLEKWISGDEYNFDDATINGNKRMFCWESNDRKLHKDHICTECLAYRVRALNCFLLRNAVDVSLIRCDKSCKECDYFKEYFN